MKRVLVLIAILLLPAGCCKQIALRNADHFSEMGYETRIAVYHVGIDGLILGLGLWKYHAQAQVKVDGEWKWVGGGRTLSDETAYSLRHEVIDGVCYEYYAWTADNYRALLSRADEVRSGKLTGPLPDVWLIRCQEVGK